MVYSVTKTADFEHIGDRNWGIEKLFELKNSHRKAKPPFEDN